MLKSIKVDSLFGLYSYTLDLMDSEESRIKFITGPNGYGKTTLLSFTNALYSGDFGIFFKVPFKSVEFGIGDDLIRIDKNVDGVKFDDTLDESFGSETSTLNVRVTKRDVSNKDYVILADAVNEDSKVLMMYLKSLPCYYVKDQRLFRKSFGLKSSGVESPMLTEPVVMGNAAHLKVQLENVVADLTLKLQTLISGFDLNDDINEEDYNVKRNRVVSFVDKLKQYGILPNGFSVYNYEESIGVFLNTYIEALETALHSIDAFVGKLDAFKTIIDRYEFADKELEINPKFGYRFRLKNATRTILFPSDLSSGEQHILIMAYELIFKAQDNSVVLIDEPEMSFHLMWQTEFLNTLRDIVDVREQKLQCIVATHSPQIFDSRWDLTVDLFTQANKKDE